jgi:hypothetical protein
MITTNEIKQETADMPKTNNLYTAYVSNASGATDTVSNGGNKFTSIREAETAARRQYGAGWTVHIERILIDGDGQSYMGAEEVKTFTLRK